MSPPELSADRAEPQPRRLTLMSELQPTGAGRCRSPAQSAPQQGQRVPARGPPRAAHRGPAATGGRHARHPDRARACAAPALDSDLQRYLFLSDLQSRNEVLFYAVVMADPATFMPLVYTPTAGEACQKFDHIFGPRWASICRSRQRDGCASCSPTGRSPTCASSLVSAQPAWSTDPPRRMARMAWCALMPRRAAVPTTDLMVANRSAPQLERKPPVTLR